VVTDLDAERGRREHDRNLGLRIAVDHGVGDELGREQVHDVEHLPARPAAECLLHEAAGLGAAGASGSSVRLDRNPASTASRTPATAMISSTVRRGDSPLST